MLLVLCALKEEGFIIEKYYAAEVDEVAKEVVRFNWDTEVENVGDVRELKGKKLKNLGSIDLLFGGSPCQDLSNANPNKRGLDG